MQPEIRPMQRSDWVPVVQRLAGPDSHPFPAFARADGQSGNPLFKAQPNAAVEAHLAAAYASLRARYPAITAARHHVHMPYWTGERVPTAANYRFVEQPASLTTTAIIVLLVPQAAIHDVTLGFHFRGATLPSLRERLQGVHFQGLVGNLGYYMTADLINHKFPWSHNRRYPDFVLPEIPSYIGFHWHSEPGTGAFESAHPAAVAIEANGNITILHDLGIDSYTVQIGSHEIHIGAANTPEAAGENVVVFTPALDVPETTGGDTWQTYTPMIPLVDAADRIHVFIANESYQGVPQEKIAAVWEGRAPLPSFGAVLSFKRPFFETLFGPVGVFKTRYLHQPVRIIPAGRRDFNRYRHIMGGLVPAVIDGHYLYLVDTVADVQYNLNRFGNAMSPIAQTGRETRNFDPHQREPAGMLIQTAQHVGWVLFDGRHELSIGASVVDATILLKKLERAGCLAGETVQQAVFIDGGSAMKVYDVSSDHAHTRLEPLNRVAAGARNGPSPDYEGLNLYSTLSLALNG